MVSDGFVIPVNRIYHDGLVFKHTYQKQGDLGHSAWCWHDSIFGYASPRLQILLISLARDQGQWDWRPPGREYRSVSMCAVEGRHESLVACWHKFSLALDIPDLLSRRSCG